MLYLLLFTFNTKRFVLSELQSVEHTISTLALATSRIKREAQKTYIYIFVGHTATVVRVTIRMEQ